MSGAKNFEDIFLELEFKRLMEFSRFAKVRLRG